MSGETQTAIDAMLSGQMPPADMAAFLTDLTQRGETVEDIVGAARALRAHVSPVSAPDNAVDCCGTGGDGRHTLNVSTAVAFVLAGCGVPVAKHGNRAASSKCGAADVLAELDIPLDAPREKLESALRDIGFCFLMAPNHHRALAHVAPVRKSLGHRTVFNLLGPLANPAGVKRQMIGVYAPQWVRPMAEALRALGATAAWVVHGDGMDEIALSGPTQVAMLDSSGKISDAVFEPSDFGFQRIDADELRGGDAANNARALMDLLDGELGAYRDTVIANAAAALVMAGRARDLRDGVAMATAALDEGRARNILDAYRQALA